MKLFGACITTHQIEAMVDFYTKVFGCEPYIDGPDHRFLDAQLILFRLEDKDAPSAQNAGMIYAVDDVDAEYARLKPCGIAVDPPTDKPWGVRSFIIHDPDGNLVSFFSGKPAADGIKNVDLNDIETTIYFYVRNDAFVINNVLCGNQDFLWENIWPVINDNVGILKEAEDGLWPPLDEKTIARLQSRIYEKLDDDVKAKILKTARNDIDNILSAMKPAEGKMILYRTVIAVDHDPRPHIQFLSNYKIDDIVEFKNISSTSVAPGWGEDKGLGFYRYEIAVPQGGYFLALDQFDCRNEAGEVLLPPMKCRVTNICKDENEKCRGIIELEYMERLPVDS